ncbi:MAG: cation diffusion facilitator family transporter [Rhodospirillaceae bacterium]|nr:cation diffusion facilitator family transporter [Rhodospirillaceae bacterium]
MGTEEKLTGEAAARLRDRATWASISVAAGLGVVKLAAWLLTGSVAVLSSVVDSVADLTASVITRFTVHQAHRPADTSHRFGHGKVEPLGALIQAAAILGSALFVLAQAIFRLVEPVQVAVPLVGLVVMVVSIVVSVALVTFQRSVVRRTGSIGIDADMRHYASDLFLNLGVIVSLYAVEITGAVWIDALAGAAIALALIWGATGIARRAFDILMDKELPPDDRARIEAIVHANPAARGLHDLRTRTSGVDRFIEFHLELDGQLSLRVAHRVTDEVERALCDAFPDAQVLVHQEPAGLDDDRLDERILQAERHAAPDESPDGEGKE